MNRAGFATFAIMFVTALGLSMVFATPTTPTTRGATVDRGYVFALTAANDFLHQWAHRDWPEGVKLLSPRLLKSRDRDELEMEISGPSNPHHQAFEIGTGRKDGDERYIFEVTLYCHYSYMKEPIEPMVTEITLAADPANPERWLVDEMPESAWERKLKASR